MAASSTVMSQSAPNTTPMPSMTSTSLYSDVCAWFDGITVSPEVSALSCTEKAEVCAYNIQASLFGCVNTNGPGGALDAGTALFPTGCTLNPSGTSTNPYLITCVGQQVCYTGLATISGVTLSAFTCGWPAVTFVIDLTSSPTTAGFASVSSFPTIAPLVSEANVTYYGPRTPTGHDTTIVLATATPPVSLTQYFASVSPTTASPATNISQTNSSSPTSTPTSASGAATPTPTKSRASGSKSLSKLFTAMVLLSILVVL